MIWHSMPSCRFVFLHFLLQNVLLKPINIFVFFVFILTDVFGPSRQRNHRKYFAKQHFHAPAWTLSKFYYRNQTGNPKPGVVLPYMGYIAGLEIATNTVEFATKFVPFATKISREVANLRLIFTSALSKQKDYQLPIICYFNKVKKKITKLFCFVS